jgi:4-hydroxy-tetrahydrodipicolinate synthase
MAIGAKGVISVISNVMPKQTHQLTAAALAGDYNRAREIHFQLLPLMRALFFETNPIPVKYAVSLLGKCSAEVRMPLTPLSPGPAAKLREVMKQLNLI